MSPASKRSESGGYNFRNKVGVKSPTSLNTRPHIDWFHEVKLI